MGVEIGMIVMEARKGELGKERVHFAYTYTSQLITERSQGRNLETRADTEVMGECWLLACSPWLTQPFLQHSGPPAQGWHHKQWTGQLLFKKCPTGFPTAQSYGGIFSTEVPSSHCKWYLREEIDVLITET